jgi:hypothetical protein
MKSSLESLLAASLSDLKDLNAPVTSNTELDSPVESLTVISADQIQQDVLEHMKDERYNDEDAQRQVAEEYFERNEQEHAALRGEIAQVQEAVSTVISSMEMLSVLVSMESIDDNTAEMAENAMGAIALQAGEQVPNIEVEDGKLTTASMEGLTDFIKNAFAKLKKWVKEKFENMAINARRGAVYREVMVKRITALQARMEKMPEDYGIPAKPIRYDAAWTSVFSMDNKPVDFTESELKKAFDEAYKLLVYGVDNLATDAVKRSSAVADVLAGVLVARDGITAEEQLKGLYKELTKELPVSKAVANGREIAGMTFVDGSMGYRSRYRDVDWIMDLVNLMEPNQLGVKYRRTGRTSGQADDLKRLISILDVVVDAVEREKTFNYDYYNELSVAWREANECYDKLWSMVVNMEFAHMTNELWRALDIACTSMFTFLDKAYYHTETCRAPYLRLINSTTSVLEEQMKAYVAINR